MTDDLAKTPSTKQDRPEDMDLEETYSKPTPLESKAAEGRTWGDWGARPPKMMTDDLAKARSTEQDRPEDVGAAGFEPATPSL
jgi:hypothetical protein